MISDLSSNIPLTLLNKLKNLSVQLESQNVLTKFEKEILCDKVNGIHTAFERLMGSKSVIELLQAKIQALLLQDQGLFKDFKQLEELAQQVITEKTSIMDDYQEFLAAKDSIVAKQDKTIRALRDKCISLKAEKDNFIPEREGLKSKVSELEKKYSDIFEEQRKLRLKLKQRSSISYNMDDEKYCSRCQKTYFETENFNWSCKTHQAKIHDNIYWCCGKQGSDAPGCLVTKHTSKDDDHASKNEIYAVKFCASCKSHGHVSAECPKDPNMKTVVDLGDERERLELMYLKQRRISLVGTGLHDKINESLGNKMMGSNFAREMDSDEEDELMDGVYFRDLMDIKEELDIDKPFTFGVVESDEIGPEELEMMQKYSKKRTGFVAARTLRD